MTATETSSAQTGSPLPSDTSPPPRRAKRRLRVNRVWLAVLLALLVAAVIWQRQRSSPGPVVTTAAAHTAPLVAQWTATGYVEARTAQVSSPQVGRIVQVLVREGDRVRAGQTLARLETGQEAAAAQAQREALQAAAAQAQAARAAWQEAAQAQGERVRQAEGEVAAARARLRQAQAALVRSRRAASANLATARAQAEAARHQLLDLQQGARPEEIEQARAVLADAEAAATRTRIERDRQAVLLKEGAVAPRAVDDATEALARAEASVQRARAALELLQKGARPEEIAAARSRLQAAEGQVAAAEAQLAGLEAEEQVVDEMAARVRSAEAALAQARSGALRVTALQREAQAAGARRKQAEATLRQARAALQERTAPAPFAGQIGRRFVDPGDLAAPSQPLFTVVEVDRAWVAAEVDAQDLAAVHQGQLISLSVPAYPGRTFPGRVAVVGAEAIPQTEVRTSARIVRVRISLAHTPAPDRALLKPGMEVDVAGQATLVPQAILVPNDAILTDAEGNYVLTVEDGKVVRQRVKTGYSSSRFTEIRSGLRDGQQVVVSGKEGLQEGMRVTVRGEGG